MLNKNLHNTDVELRLYFIHELQVFWMEVDRVRNRFL